MAKTEFSIPAAQMRLTKDGKFELFTTETLVNAILEHIVHATRGSDFAIPRTHYDMDPVTMTIEKDKESGRIAITVKIALQPMKGAPEWPQA